MMELFFSGFSKIKCKSVQHIVIENSSNIEIEEDIYYTWLTNCKNIKAKILEEAEFNNCSDIFVSEEYKYSLGTFNNCKNIEFRFEAPKDEPSDIEFNNCSGYFTSPGEFYAVWNDCKFDFNKNEAELISDDDDLSSFGEKVAKFKIKRGNLDSFVYKALNSLCKSLRSHYELEENDPDYEDYFMQLHGQKEFMEALKTGKAVNERGESLEDALGLYAISITKGAKKNAKSNEDVYILSIENLDLSFTSYYIYTEKEKEQMENDESVDFYHYFSSELLFSSDDSDIIEII